jgi:glutathione peroxidase
MTTAKPDLYSIPVARIDGRAATLGEYRDKVLLVVNVASRCGLTPQYEALQRLYVEKRARGLEVLGFPSNDFGRQEPGTESEIAAFCSTNYGVEFPMFKKITVKGPDRHPLYDALIAEQPQQEGSGKLREMLRGLLPGSPTDITWNFEKFVVGRDGAVVARFAPSVTPDDPRLIAVLDDALAAPA